MLALADRGDDPPGRGFDHLGDHAVLDAERAFVLEEDDLVASSEVADTILRPEGMAVIDKAALDELGARQRR